MKSSLPPNQPLPWYQQEGCLTTASRPTAMPTHPLTLFTVPQFYVQVLVSALLIFTPSLRQLERSARFRHGKTEGSRKLPKAAQQSLVRAENWTAWPQAGHLPTTLPCRPSRNPR